MLIRNRILPEALLAGILGLILWEAPLGCTAHAQTNSAIVRLSSSSSAKCGTGFFIEDGRTLVTNAHLARSLCSNQRCPGVALRSANAEQATEAEQALKDLTVQAVFPAIDIALLELPPGERNPNALKFSSATPQYGAVVTMIGFPGCADPVTTSGNIHDLNEIWFNSGANGTGGSSGSPILNSHGEVIGVGFQVDSFLSLFTDLWGSGSYNLRAIRSDVIQALREVAKSARIKSEAALLLEFYSHSVATSSGLTRLHRGVFFLNSARSLVNLVASETEDIELLRAANLVDRWPDALWQNTHPIPSSQQGKIMERLAFAANIEARGPIDHSLHRLDSSKVSSALQAQGRSADEIKHLLELLPSPGARQIPGTLPTLLFTAALITTATVVFIVAWSWSLGYVYARASGGRAKRLAISLLVALAIWPVSLIVFRLFFCRAEGSKV